MLLLKLIQKVNEKKVGTEENIIVGASMGGLITRYALAYMEKNNLPHCTRLYVSFDSPHLGANVPVGVQFATMLSKDYSQTGFEGVEKLKSSAAQQMLLRSVITDEGGITEEGNIATNTCYRTHFVTSLNAIGFPKKCRNIAIANGSQKGLGQGFGYFDELMKWPDWKSWGVLLGRLNIRSQPQVTNSENVMSGVLSKTVHGGWQTLKWDAAYFPENGNALNYDGAPGGQIDAT